MRQDLSLHSLSTTFVALLYFVKDAPSSQLENFGGEFSSHLSSRGYMEEKICYPGNNSQFVSGKLSKLTLRLYV